MKNTTVYPKQNTPLVVRAHSRVPHKPYRFGIISKKTHLQVPILLGLFLFIGTVGPHVQILGRTTDELFEFCIAGVWLTIVVFRRRLITLRFKWLVFWLWMLPVSVLVSSFVYTLQGGMIGKRDLYELVVVSRPLITIHLVIAACRFGRVSEGQIQRVTFWLYGVVAVCVGYVGLIGVLQFFGLPFVANYLDQFYGYQTQFDNSFISFN